MTLAHLVGLPLEETVVQLAPAGAATLTAVALAGRTRLRRLPALFKRPVTGATQIESKGETDEKA